MLSNSELCELCGEPMPFGESMFKFHGYSGPCPKPPLPEKLAQSPEMIRAERDALAKEVERLKSDFTVDIDIMDAFKELFAIGAEYKVPEYILREWKIKWLERHLRFHNGKEDALKKDVDRLRSKLEVAREALERATHPHMDRFCIERARTALAQIGTSDEGA